jgi:hypothetical protein
MTIVTGSLSPAPNSTGFARRTKLRPVCFTDASGRACARAKPGAMTMYGPCSSMVASIESVYSGSVAPVCTSRSPAAMTAERQSSAGT